MAKSCSGLGPSAWPPVTLGMPILNSMGVSPSDCTSPPLRPGPEAVALANYCRETDQPMRVALVCDLCTHHMVLESKDGPCVWRELECYAPQG